MPSAMGIPAQGMSAVPMQRAPQYKINPAMRNPQQPPVAGQPMPAPVRTYYSVLVMFDNVGCRLVHGFRWLTRLPLIKYNQYIFNIKICAVWCCSESSHWVTLFSCHLRYVADYGKHDIMHKNYMMYCSQRRTEQHAEKIWWSLDVRFLRYVCEHTERNRSSLYTPTGAE